MDCIKINPLEELLKSIAIVHGKEVADRWRYIVYRWLDSHTLDAVEWD